MRGCFLPGLVILAAMLSGCGGTPPLERVRTQDAIKVDVPSTDVCSATDGERTVVWSCKARVRR